MLRILKRRHDKNKYRYANEILDRAAMDFFNHPEVQEILRTNPESEKILNDALKNQTQTGKKWMVINT